MAKLISPRGLFLRVFLAAVLCGFGKTGDALANLLERATNASLQMPAQFPVAGYGVVNAFGDLSFTDPVVIASVPGETNRIFIGDRAGSIWVITNLAAPTRTLFLNATQQLVAGGDAGLLGLAFHPGYATNGYFYIFRTIQTSLDEIHFGLHNELARYSVDPQNPDQALPESKLRLLIQYDHSDVHNGGTILFGPDGYLYLSMGDTLPPPWEGPPPPQAIDRHFFGGILRLDVDKRPGNLPPNPHIGGTEHYLIPADNPFIGVTNHHGLAVDPAKLRTEFYAIGFRSPWKITFDGSDLYCGDVGSSSWEEVSLVRPGGNYGWPFMEGNRPNSEAPAGFTSIAPIYEYSRGSGLLNGKCVIGGLVYRGARMPQLEGAYIFGDLMRGRIWAMRHDGTNATNVQNLVTVPQPAGVPSITAFGTDPANGDVLVAVLDGRLLRLVHVPPETAGVPLTLADAGVFTDLAALTPHPGILPYELNTPFWSDHAIKQRWFSVPDPAQQIGFTASTNWLFPTGTVWIKQFDLELTNGSAASRRRIETRLLVKNPDGAYGLTYRWDDSQTNATLVEAGGLEETFDIHDGNGGVRQQTWVYPSRSDCMKCHNAAAGYALGFNTPQLNRQVLSNAAPVNQLQLLASLGYFSNAVPEPHTLIALVPPTNSAAPIQDRMRSYWQANCAACHHSDGPLGETWNAQITTPMSAAGIINGHAYAPEAYRVVKPGDVVHSFMHYRLTSRFARMPPLSTSVIDSNSVAMLEEFILSLPLDPWAWRDIGTPGREGSSSISLGVHRVSGTGTNATGGTDTFHYLFQPFTGNGQMTARLISSTDDAARAGIMFRSGTASNAPHVWLNLGAGGHGQWQRRLTNDADTVVTHDLNPNGATWLRLVREGSSLRAYASVTSNDWALLAEETLELGSNALMGLAITSSNVWATATAAFEQVAATTVRLVPPVASTVGVTDSVELHAEVTAYGTPVQAVEFFVGTNKVGEATTPPYAAVWTNALAGEWAVRARVLDTAGGAVFSEPVTMTRTLPSTSVLLGGTDGVTGGNWKGAYGEIGFTLAGATTNLPALVAFSLTGETVLIWDPATAEPRALEGDVPTERIAAAWTAPTNLSVQLTLLDGALYQVGLYFLDWETGGLRQQRVDVFDLSNGAPLVTHTLSNFHAGVFLTCLVRGTVEIQITSLSGHSAVLSGLFVDNPGLQLLPSPRFEDGLFTFDILRKKAVEIAPFVVEVSENLIQWSPATNGVLTEINVVDLGSMERVSLQFTAPTNASPRRFVRLKF